MHLLNKEKNICLNIFINAVKKQIESERYLITLNNSRNSDCISEIYDKILNYYKTE